MNIDKLLEFKEAYKSDSISCPKEGATTEKIKISKSDFTGKKLRPGKI